MLATRLTERERKIPSAHYAVPTGQLYTFEERKRFFTDDLSKVVTGIGRWENPFDISTFPMMNNITYSVWFQHGELYMEGKNADYEKELLAYQERRYIKGSEEMINKGIDSVTKPRLFNIVTGQLLLKPLQYHLDENTELAIKVVDLGAIYDEHRYDRVRGNEDLMEIHNEARVGFFLNELLYAYSEVATRHFMQVVDWFASDINLYPKENGKGPYQYIVSEKLDLKLKQYLEAHPDMITLQCTLFCIAQALEMAWYTHSYLHFDLHRNNVMLKTVVKESKSFDKNYLYTRPDRISVVYKLPQEGIHNAIVKIIDFGRNSMRIPSVTSREGLYDHVDTRNGYHGHDDELEYTIPTHGIGEKNNRIWDIRRLLWDLMIDFPVSYWNALFVSNKVAYNQLIAQMSEFIDMKEMTKASRGTKKTIDPIHASLSTNNTQLTIEKIIGLDIRNDYINASTDEKTGPDFKAYIEWYERVRLATIYSPLTKTEPNATTFLDSDLFSEFKTTNIVNMDTDVWMGRTPMI